MTVPSIGAFGGADTISPGTSPRTLSFDIGTPSNSKLFVGLYTADTDDTVTGITWNGSAMTQRAESGSSTTYDCEIWELDAPSGGTNNLEISYTGDGTYGGQVWWVRVDDAGATGTPFTANGTGTSVSSGSQTCPTNGMLLAFAVHNFSSTAPSITAGTNIALTQPTNRRPVAGYRTSTGTISWTFASSQGWNLVGVPISEISGGSPGLDLDPAALALSGAISVSGDIDIGTSFDVSASPVALAGSLAVSGDIQITEAPELDLDPAALALAGALSISGDIEVGTSHDLAADPVALSGALAVSGDIEASVDPVLDIDASAIALSGSLAVSGDIDIGTSFDVEASAVALTGAVSVSGDIEIGTTFDLAADPVALAGSLALAGDVEASDTPVQSGILEIDWEPNLWWKRKPKALPEKVAREKLKKAATVIAKKAEEQVKADVVAEKEQRKAEAREAVRPMLAEMPGFDWQALYDEAYSRALNAAVAQAMREQEAMAQAKAAIDRARLLDDEDVEILMALL